MKCTKKFVEYDCEQFVKHPHEGKIKVEQQEGLSGYAAKLGIIRLGNGKNVSVRPNDWVLNNPLTGEVYVVNNEEFHSGYDLTVEKPRKMRNTRSKESYDHNMDNAFGAHSEYDHSLADNRMAGAQ